METNNRTTIKSRLQRYLLPSLTGDLVLKRTKSSGWRVGLLSLVLSAALTLQASAYTVTPVDEAPQWQVDWSGTNQDRPDWQEPDASAYASFAVMIVTIEEALQPYVSEDDLLAIFVGDELRGVASPLVKGDGTTDATRFLLKGYSNENAGDQVVVTMKYYNAQLKQLFSLSESMTLDEDSNVGIYDDFIPPFTLGSAKYPVVTTVSVTDILKGITPGEGDILAAFVGDDCRGVWSAGDSPASITVFQQEEGEDVVFMYYDAQNDRLITSVDGKISQPGDTNFDGTVDVADISTVITAMANGSAGDSPAVSDVNGDGVVDVADIATIITIMSKK